jgi:polyisoprenyl-phosphate glycosyltransferase
MKISLVVPVFNEQEAISEFYRAVREYPFGEGQDVEIVFVNDGSIDATEQVIDEISRSDPLVLGIHFSRNFGKEAAIFAGLEFSSGDAVVPIDVDLQDPISLIPDMISKWKDGAEIVLAKRVDRSSDSFLKRKTAEIFYSFHNAMSYHRIEPNVGDFRLLDRRIVESILLLQERGLFMKGLLSWPGGKTAIVEYARAPRTRGTSKFNGWKLWNFALEGITSFSTAPLRIWTYIGTLLALLSLIYSAATVVDTLIWGNPVSGYASIFVAILLIGGVQLIGIGILGEYIGRMYIEVKARPRYIISRRTNGEARLSRRGSTS